MTAPAGVKVTHTPPNPECWVVPVGDRWATLRFHPASEPGAKREYPAYVTCQGPTCERRTEPDDLERFADALYAAAKHARRVRAEAERDDTHLTLFEVAS